MNLKIKLPLDNLKKKKLNKTLHCIFTGVQKLKKKRSNSINRFRYLILNVNKI
jgi:hypothetical protein